MKSRKPSTLAVRTAQDQRTTVESVGKTPWWKSADGPATKGIEIRIEDENGCIVGRRLEGAFVWIEVDDAASSAANEGPSAPPVRHNE